MTQKIKSQKLAALLLALLTMVSLFTFVTADTTFAASDGEWYYNVVDGKAEITNYVGANTVLNVPAIVDGYSVKKVTGLVNNFYKGRITSITFSQGITEIGDAVCQGYTALEKVSMPTTMTTIGKNAFAGCTSLKDITLTEELNSVGASAFKGCSALEKIVINTKNLTCGDSIFANCKITLVHFNTF